jgi:hypothetical protein
VVGLGNPRVRAGVDYPDSYAALQARFPTDEACVAYLGRLRWRQGFICPLCGSANEPWQTARGQRMCPACGRQTTGTAGTIFDKTRTPLRTWFAAAWYVTNQAFGTTTTGLQRALGLGSYQTAWTILRKLRWAMACADRARLIGDTEIDQLHFRSSMVAIALESGQPRGYGRVRLRQIPDRSATSIVSFVRDVVHPDAVVLSSGLPVYTSLVEHGYTHKMVAPASAPGEAAAMPGIRHLEPQLRGWLRGCFPGNAVRSLGLDGYLIEWTFRSNRPTRSPGLLFYRLLEQAAVSQPPPSSTSPSGAGPERQGHARRSR